MRSDLVISAVFNTSTFALFSDNILTFLKKKNHILAEFIFFTISLLVIQHSGQYRRTDHKVLFSPQIIVLVIIVMFFITIFIFGKESLDMRILVFI